MGFVASQAGVLVTSNQHEEHLHERREELRGHIRALQRRRTQIYEELAALQAQHAEFSVQVQQARATATTAVHRENPWMPRPRPAQPVSWDLTEPRRSITDVEIDDLSDRIQYLSQEEAALKQSIADALTAKQKTELHLTTSEAELKQLQAKIAEQSALKQTLNQTILELEQDQNQLQANIPQIQAQIQALEAKRDRLESDLQTASAPTPQSDAGAIALKQAIDQMQDQIMALRDELGDLETQIIDRRNEKRLLDQTIEQLQRDRSKLHPTSPTDPHTQPSSSTRLPAVSQPTATASVGMAEPATKHDSQHSRSVTKGNDQETARANTQSSQIKEERPVPAPTPDQSPQAQGGLPPEWLLFKGKLQPYEFQALCAIALEENPTSVLKHLAESNLTMPEMLIDTINEQALEAIGDLILEAGRDVASTIIAQEYRDEVATLIATHR